MKHGSLFSGIGGFDLAAEWMGWENVFHCENNSFCQKILKYYWPDAKSYGDIKETDFSQWKGSVDIISGGFPCQPYSQAGKRKGKEDERHLWPEMLRAIREVQPRWVVGENVSGLLNWNGGMVLDEIKADLEAAGFEVFPPLVLPACGKNAPHRRDRLWIVAYNSNARAEGLRESKDCFYELKPTAYPNLSGCQREGKQQIPNRKKGDSCNGWSGAVTNSKLERLQEWNDQQNGGRTQSILKRYGGFEQWQDFPTQSPICGGNVRVPNRVDRIKALGNSVVPQVVYEIFKAIQQIENNQ